MKILQVSTHDHFGGAEAIMQSLHRGASVLGHSSVLAYGEKHDSSSNGIYLDREQYGSWLMRRGIKFSHFVRRQIPPSLKPAYKKTLGIGFSQPVRMIKRMMGLEDFDHPVSRQLLGLYGDRYQGQLPDIVQLHTLHGDYFDLRWLPELSQQVPVYLTLHDQWAMTGHCGYPLDCERWRTGCGSCPYLDSYPSITRDATAYNFKRKKEIYSRSKIKVAAPSRWLLDRFRQSPLSQYVLEFRHIPNGIDLKVFCPGNRSEVREILGLPQDARICLFVARGGRSNRYKDYETIYQALLEAKKGLQEKLMLVVLGEMNSSLQDLGIPIVFEDIRNNRERMAMFYQASDFYLHAANAENYPTVIMEAMACGTPVVATNVGGISEQIQDKFNGLLVDKGDFKGMGDAILMLTRDRIYCEKIAQNAIKTSKEVFCENKMIKNYLEWWS